MQYQIAELTASQITGMRLQILQLIRAMVEPVGIYTFFRFVEGIRMPFHKRINRIAETTFGIYLLHGSSIGNNLIWTHLFHLDTKYLCGLKIYAGSILISSLLVFFICSVFDFIRINFIQHYIDSFTNRVFQFIRT